MSSQEALGTCIEQPFELNLLDRPPAITPAMNRLWVNLELFCMLRKTNRDSPKRINVEMEQIVVMTRNRMVAHNVEVDVLVNVREELAHVLLKHLEHVVNVHLAHEFAVSRGILESKSFPSGIWRAIDNSIAVASTVRVDYSRPIAARALERFLGLLGE
jgi:hypothetical protein